MLAATSVTDVAAVVSTCLVAGAANALAGGGSLVSYPTMVAVGLSPVTANVSNTLALWPGYVSGAASLRHRLAEADGSLTRYAIAASLGAVGGTVLLLAGNPDVFEALVPYLVILSALLLAIPEPWVEQLRKGRLGRGRAGALAMVALAGVYGAYFGGALGVILLAVLNAFVGSSLRSLNAMKAVLSLLINSVALVAFVGFGPVAWWAVAAGGPASALGGITGGRLADRVPATALRRAVVIVGLTAGVALLLT
ncbi:MAG: sulfite exporter TauE/SafE family protein [Acidimicrobiales bacterium]